MFFLQNICAKYNYGDALQNFTRVTWYVLVLTEGLNIIVHENISAYFIATYNHDAWKYLLRTLLWRLCFHCCIKKKSYSAKVSYCQSSDIWEGTLVLKVQSCELYNNKYMIASTQITNTEIFAFLSVLVFKILSRKVLFTNRKDNRNC